MQTYSLTPLQKTMLFTSVTEPHAGFNIEQIILHIPALIDGVRLQKAWNQVMLRHDILRNSFHWPGGAEPYQITEDPMEMPWQVLDWQDSSPNKKNQDWEELLIEDRRNGFAMNQAPLMRCFLVAFNDDENRLLWTFHHILLDGRSISIVLEDVFSIYDDLLSGETANQSKSKPFYEFVDWLKGLDEKPSLQYWKQLLHDVELREPLQLGELDRDITESSSPYQLDHVCLNEKVAADLEALAKKQDITLNALVQAAWALVLSRYQDNPDIVFGAVRACRYWGGEAQKDRVGLFINNLPVRVQIDEELTVAGFLQSVRQQHIDIRPFEFSPRDKIKEWAELPREAVLLESTVMFEQGSFTGNLHRALPHWASVRVEIHECAGLPLMLGATRDNGLCLELEYDKRRFNPILAQRMLEHVKQAIITLAESPEKKLGEISILKPEEYQKLIYEWNQKPNNYCLDQCAHHFVELVAGKFPDTVAVESREFSLTYTELNSRSNRLAHRLRRLGIGAGHWVGISVERTPWMIICILGIMKSGAAYVPLDPEYPSERKEFIVNDAELSGIICDQASFISLPQTRATVLIVDREWEDIRNESDANPDVLSKSDAAAYMIYTSGSTGTPKGVVNLHRGLVNEIQNVMDIFTVGPGDRILQFSTINFDAAVEEIFVALMAGATLVLRAKEMLTTRQHFHQGVQDLKITMLDLPTAFWSQWVNYMDQEHLEPPQSLKVVVVGGEKVAANVYEAWQRVTEGRVRWVNTYGPTETSIISHYYVSPDTPGNRIYLQDIPIGKVLANDYAYVLDSQKRPVPFGAEGELYIGGAGVARGYWNRSELTKKAFFADPYLSIPEALMYRTGDRVRYLEDGNLEYLGRTDFQVKIRGYRVEPGEIELALGSHPDVAEVVVVPHKMDRNNLVLVAYIVSPKDSLTSIELREYLKSRLPDYMIPQVFMTIKELPLTPNGKVDRNALPKPVFNKAGEENIIAPCNPMEDKLTAVFSKVLRLEKVSVTGNFFDYGGDSLLTIELIEEAMKTGIELDPQTIFQYPGIRQLSNFLSSSSNDEIKEKSPLVPLNAQGDRPPIYFVHATPGDVMGYGNLVYHLGSDQPIYGFISRGLFDPDLCHKTIEEMAAYYIEHLITFDPAGPYILGGWCYGGTVVFEMARQLRELGREVALLILIECMASPPKGKFGEFRYKLRRMASFFRMPLKGQSIYIKNKINHRLAPDFDRLEDNIALTESPASLVNRLTVYRENMKAFWRFRSSPYNGPMDVFLSNNPCFDTIYDAKGGWPLITKQARYHYFSGRHDTILKEPVVNLLAERIRQLIDSC